MDYGEGQRMGSYRNIKKAARPYKSRVYGPKHPLAGQQHRSGGRRGDRKGQVWRIDGAPPPVGETRFFLVERIDRNTIRLNVCDGLAHN